MTGMLDLVEDDLFYFDEAAADRPVRFIEKFCEHYEGQHAGKKFILHPLQRKIVRDLYGWHWRKDKTRRFTDCYFEAAAGAGKSPLLAALGLYGLCADHEPAAQIYSLASTYGQAKVVFDTAKKFINQSLELSKRIEVVERQIRHKASGSTWEVVSGKGPGSGRKPSLILADEVHEWGGPVAYDQLRVRMFKRKRPLLIAATNAGDSQASFCWKLREKAVNALAGIGEKSLYPIIWKAADDAKTDDPKAWKDANPLLGVTMAPEKIADEAREAMKDPDDEAKFRRMYMSIWPTTAVGRWLDLEMYDKCISVEKMPTDCILYVGMDLAQSSDLCAVIFIGVTAGKFYIESKFWIPRATATAFEAKDGIPYDDWAKKGHITLLDEKTISAPVRKEIAAHIIARHKRQKVRAVCYDVYRADETVAALEAAGVKCVPISQGFSTSPGCFALDRGIKEGSILIERNDVLRFCAENAEVLTNNYAEIRVVKPNAKGKFAGTNSKKVDGISATVTGLTEARKANFEKRKSTPKVQSFRT
jgi:phage terminase large subunit-like protein